MRYSLDKNMIKFYFGEFDFCEIITNDNIIDQSKEIRSTGFDVVRQSDKEEKELEKLLLLYAYEQEMKGKINNLTYRETEFNNYYLISKEWITRYKKEEITEDELIIYGQFLINICLYYGFQLIPNEKKKTNKKTKTKQKSNQKANPNQKLKKRKKSVEEEEENEDEENEEEDDIEENENKKEIF